MSIKRHRNFRRNCRRYSRANLSTNLRESLVKYLDGRSEKALKVISEKKTCWNLWKHLRENGRIFTQKNFQKNLAWSNKIFKIFTKKLKLLWKFSREELLKSFLGNYWKLCVIEFKKFSENSKKGVPRGIRDVSGDCMWLLRAFR